MRKVFIPFVVFVSLAACSWFQPKPQQTQLQIREYQTRAFDTKNTKLVMKAVLGVLQDEGFIVKNADSDLGFISASKETDLGGAPIFWGTKDSEPARYRKTSVIETTANVSEFGSQCRVRMNFMKKILDNTGATMEVDQITDAKFYQDFFSKVDKGLFLQKEKL